MLSLLTLPSKASGGVNISIDFYGAAGASVELMDAHLKVK